MINKLQILVDMFLKEESNYIQKNILENIYSKIKNTSIVLQFLDTLKEDIIKKIKYGAYWPTEYCINIILDTVTNKNIQSIKRNLFNIIKEKAKKYKNLPVSYLLELDKFKLNINGLIQYCQKVKASDILHIYKKKEYQNLIL